MFLRLDQRRRSEVYYHVSHSVRLQRGAPGSSTCSPLSLWMSLPRSLAPSLPPSLPGFQHRGTRRWWVPQMELKCLVPQLSPMQIALSTDSISENSQQSVLFDAFFLLISCHDVIICGTAAASLVNVSDSHLLISLSLSLSCWRFTATPTWPPTVSTTFTHGECFCSAQSTCREANCLRWNTRSSRKLNRPRSQNCYTDTLNIQ